MIETLTFRTAVAPADLSLVRQVVDSTGFFNPCEVDLAVELVETRLEYGQESGYNFVFAEMDGKLAGYTNFGKIDCTESSYDLFWIAVSRDLRGKGIGTAVLLETERIIRQDGPGRRVYAETSSRAQYEPTRKFYERCGYRQVAFMEDFYARGDGKVVYLKVLD